MARVLIVGGGCRGRALAGALSAQGHAMRITTRGERGREAIERAGAECAIADPGRLGTMRYALDGASVLVWALATASGPPDAVAALHRERLATMLSQVLDTPVRGLVYEAAGSVPREVLEAGAAAVREAGRRSAIPVELIEADPARPDAWLSAAGAAIGRLLSGAGGPDPNGPKISV